MTIKSIQCFYDTVCLKYNVLRVKVYIVPDKQLIRLKGLYIEWPYRKIYLNQSHFDKRTVYHEIFHHIRPDLNDGDIFEQELDKFIFVNKDLII